MALPPTVLDKKLQIHCFEWFFNAQVAPKKIASCARYTSATGLFIKNSSH